MEALGPFGIFKDNIKQIVDESRLKLCSVCSAPADKVQSVTLPCTALVTVKQAIGK